jgi:hypothetical protein
VIGTDGFSVVVAAIEDPLVQRSKAAIAMILVGGVFMKRD